MSASVSERYVSAHDPLCGQYCDGKPPKCRGGDCTLCDEMDCSCDLIYRVREGWYEAQSEAWAQGYEHALRMVSEKAGSLAHEDPCDCDVCMTAARIQVFIESLNDPDHPRGTIVRCSGCASVHVRTKEGWLGMDGDTAPTWASIQRAGCGPVKVIYDPRSSE